MNESRYSTYMAWMKHIDLVINEAYATEAPPHNALSMAHRLRQDGHDDVAGYVERMSESAYDDMIWNIEVRQMNEQDPRDEDELTDVEVEMMFFEQGETRESGYPEYDYDEAYACK